MMFSDEQLKFIDDVINSVLQKNHSVLICGVNSIGLIIASKLIEIGYEENIVGFFDPIHGSLPKQQFLGLPLLSLNELSGLKIDEIVIAYDKEKELILELVSKKVNSRVIISVFGSKNYDYEDNDFNKILSSLHVKSKAGGYDSMLIHIYQSLLYLEDNRIEGDIFEFGTFRGGTTVFMAKVLQKLNSQRTIYSFDTFNGFPKKKSPLDIFDETEYQNVELQTVKNYCSPYKIKLIPGDLVETIKDLKPTTIAFSFFDTDNYTATKCALEWVYPLTSKGGVFAFDHYFSKGWVKTVGERLAVKEVFADKRVFHLHGNGIFIKL